MAGNLFKLFGDRSFRKLVGRKSGRRSFRPQLEPLEDRVAAATRVWDGGSPVNSNWSTAANWVGDVAPVPGVDDLEFPSVAARKANTNDFIGPRFRGLAFTGSGYTLGGNPLILAGNVTAGVGTTGNTVLFPLILDNTTTFQVAGSSVLAINGAIVGGGVVAFVKSGPGTLVLRAANTHGGITQLSEGTLDVEHPSALGRTGAGTIIAKGATLRLINVLDFPPEPLTFGAGTTGAARLINLASDATWTGPVTLGEGVNQILVDAPRTLRFTGAIGGAGGFQQVAAGSVVLAGTAPNTYAGLTQVLRGELILNKLSDVSAISGNLSIGTTGRVTVANDQQIADTSVVTLAGGGGFLGTLSVSGHEIIGGLSGAGGQVRLGAGAFLNIRGSGTFAGDITGLGSLAKSGIGTLRLEGNNSYTGSIVFEGGLEINGNQPNSRVDMHGGLLRGAGTIGLLHMNDGILDPGRGTDIGRLTANGDVHLSGPGGRLHVRLNGTMPGTQFDQLRVIGTVPHDVVVGGPTLDATIAFNAPGGTRLTIIDNTTEGNVAGSFRDMPQGKLFTLPGVNGFPDQAFRMDYTGGDFNDVDMIRNTGAMVEHLRLEPQTIEARDSTTLVGRLTDPDPNERLALSISWGDDSKEQLKFPGREPFAFSHRYKTPGEYKVLVSWFDRAGEGNSRVLRLTVEPREGPGRGRGRDVSDQGGRGPSGADAVLLGSDAAPRTAGAVNNLLPVNTAGRTPDEPERRTSQALDVVFRGSGDERWYGAGDDASAEASVPDLFLSAGFTGLDQLEEWHTVRAFALEPGA